jgi:acetyltransferase
MPRSPTFSAVARLADGTWLDLRPLVASDAPAVRQLVREMSPESRYQRFFGLVNELPPTMLRYLTEVDGHHHVAIAVWQRSAGAERLVGVGRFVRDAEDPSAAEAAISVVDDMHRRGVGRRILDALVQEARHRGLERLTWEVKRGNEGMRKLLRGAGAKAARDRGTELSFVLRLPPPAPLLAPLRFASAQMARARDFVGRL